MLLKKREVKFYELRAYCECGEEISYASGAENLCSTNFRWTSDNLTYICKKCGVRHPIQPGMFYPEIIREVEDD